VSWFALTVDHLLRRVTEAERNALQTAATRAGDDPLAEIAAAVAQEWRGALRRSTTLDARAGYLPGELELHVLADFRYRAFTRLPGMRSLLDELRVDEWRRANTVRDNLGKLSYEAPEDPETLDASGKPEPDITVPDSVLD
jgi:hypothetical protein